MKTPLEELILRLGELYDANPMEPDYREGLAEAINQARILLPIERSHLKNAWQDGAEGLLTQSPGEYIREVYEGRA